MWPPHRQKRMRPEHYERPNVTAAARAARLVFDSGLARVERVAGDMVSFVRRHGAKPEYPAEAVAATKAA
jgi:hypothetical protein